MAFNTRERTIAQAVVIGDDDFCWKFFYLFFSFSPSFCYSSFVRLDTMSSTGNCNRVQLFCTECEYFVYFVQTIDFDDFVQ